MLEHEPQQAVSEQSDALLDDLASAEHDILSLAARHGLSLDALVRWACRPETRRTVAGLCVLADAQTQLLLSRYRLVAVTRLIAQATSEADTLPAEQVRKACVDLLKTELTRAADLSGNQTTSEDAELDVLREALANADPQGSQDQAHAPTRDEDHQ